MNTHIWRYRDNQRNYPGYHLTADAEGCVALLGWLRSRKAGSEFPLRPVTPEVLGVPNNRGGAAACVGCTTFKLHVKPDAARGHFVFSEISGRLSLECSQKQVEDIVKGVGGYSARRGRLLHWRGRSARLVVLVVSAAGPTGRCYGTLTASSWVKGQKPSFLIKQANEWLACLRQVVIITSSGFLPGFP